MRLEMLVAVPGGGAEVVARVLLRLDQRDVHRLEDLADHRVVARRLDLGDRLDRLDPAGRRRRHLLGLLVVLLERGRLLGEPAMQGRAFRGRGARAASMRSNSRSMMRSLASRPAASRTSRLRAASFSSASSSERAASRNAWWSARASDRIVRCAGSLAKYIASASTMNHSSQAAGESSRNMDIADLASLSPNVKRDNPSCGPPSLRDQK